MQAMAFSFFALFAPHPAEPVPGDWIELKAGRAFTMKAPPGTKYQPGRGFDSFVGSFVHDNSQIHFGYGIYSDDLERFRGGKDIIFTDVKIDGKKSVVVTAQPNKPGCRTEVAAHVETKRIHRLSFWTPAYPKSLTLYGCANSEADVQTMKSMYRSIHFID